MFKRIAILVSIFFILPGSAVLLAYSLHHESGREIQSLSGLDGVCIVVEKIKLDAAIHGLEKDAIHKRIESVLTDGGVPVISESRMLKSPGTPYLYAVIHTSWNQHALLYAYHVRLELRQGVKLERDPAQDCPAATWQSSEPTGIIPEDKLNLLSDAVEQCATEFVVAYLKANKR
jgi:hypothetical protein